MSLDLDELAKSGRVSKDTLRRLRYPTHEQIDEQGRTKFVHDLQVREARISTLSTDRGRGSISETILRQEQADSGSPNSEPTTMPAGPLRDALGRFTSSSEEVSS